MKAINTILGAYEAGHQTLLVSGRSLFDLDINTGGEIRPLRQMLVRAVYERFGMATIFFNLALGARWDFSAFSADQRNAYEAKLRDNGVSLQEGVRAGGDHVRPPHERAFLLAASIQRTIEQTGEMLPLLLVWEFAEDLAPACENGQPGDFLMQISEMIQILAADYQRRRHPFLMILAGTSERMDQRIVNCLEPVALTLPERDDKLAFIQALRSSPRLSAATYEAGLDDGSIANITAKTPNRGLEETFQASARTDRPISHVQLVERKRADVIALSDGTLTLLDTDRIQGVHLVGANIERPLALLSLWAAQLKAGNPHTPINICLAGAPSSAKTDLALLVASLAQVPAYQLLSPKGPLVGQTERLVRLLFRVFKALGPALGMIDEVTEVFQMERNSMNLDSGASASIIAEMLNALSDSSRAGRTLLVMTTNCPWKVSSAFADRLLFVPVLSAIEADYPAILCSVASSLFAENQWDPADQTIQDAARLFYKKGATPRLMRTLINSKISTFAGAPNTALLRQAAAACAPQDPRSRASSEYADLFAIRVCSDLEMLPWHGRISEYPLPPYLSGIVSEKDGSVDLDRLNRRIAELEPHVNV